VEHRFRLQAHEVWREGLVREGVYGQSADFADVLPKGVWDESRFVFGRYNARKGEETLTGHILFRPEHGAEEENFLLATDVMVGMRGPGGPFFCNLGEFFFGSERVDEKQIVMALKTNQWGRVFYLDDDLRADGTLMPCDWGVFLAANGMGLWKWTMRDGVTWGKASNQGIFRWHEEPKAARFLATHSSSEVWLFIQEQLADSEMAFARHWLQSEGDERINVVYDWKNGGNRAEFERVMHWLLLSELSLQTETSLVWRIFPFGEDEDGYELESPLRGTSGPLEEPERLERAISELLWFFDLQPKNPQNLHLPCVQNSHFDRGLYANIKAPTAHERLEAQLQLTQWAQERGLSFD